MKSRLSAYRWVDNLFRPMLIAGMLACLVAPLGLFLEILFKSWDGTYFVLFCFFASLEGILSERALQKRRVSGYGYLISRGAEALILLLMLKLFGYVLLDLNQLLADAQQWAIDPGSFVGGIDLFLSLIFLPTWAASLCVARVAKELDVEESKKAPPEDKTSVEYYLWQTQPPPHSDRQAVLNELGELVMWGGIALLLASAAMHFLLASVQRLAAPTVLYFVLGIALLSQGRFSVLHARWHNLGTPVQANVAHRWLVWAVVFLVLVAVVALILPTRYTVGPLLALVGVLNMIFHVLSYLILLLLFLMTLPLSFLFPNIKKPPAPALDPGQLPPVEGTGGGTSPWLEILLSAIFWLTILAILGYTAYRFYRDRFGQLPDEELETTWWGQILAWLRNLWRQWRNWRRQAQSRRAQRRARRAGERSSAAGRVRRFFFPGRLSPRELVRYFYLSVARRASQAGQPRRPGQTPYEYQTDLGAHFPDLEPDLGSLTKAFVEARYSPQPVQTEDAQAVKPLWERIKALLRRHRFSNQ